MPRLGAGIGEEAEQARQVGQPNRARHQVTRIQSQGTSLPNRARLGRAGLSMIHTGNGQDTPRRVMSGPTMAIPTL
jgi:hypothetical protein